MGDTPPGTLAHHLTSQNKTKINLARKLDAAVQQSAQALGADWNDRCDGGGNGLFS